MPILIEDQKLCTGCAACANTCPRNCIKMVSDKCGFSYPAVNLEMCIACDACIKVCPVISEDRDKIQEIQDLKVYAAFSNDENVRRASSSGGIFSELARPVLESGGMVAGAGFLNPYEVRHLVIEDVEDLEKLRKSKYVQSEIGMIFREISQNLKNGRTVLFSGTPCQAAGLRQYLGRDYENLLLVDLICKGVNSPKAYRCWLQEVEIEQGSRAIRVEFRHKIDGWRKSSWRTKVDFENGSSTVVRKTEGTLMGGYLKGDLFTRPSCGVCRFKGSNRASDITIADFWGIPPEFNDDKGISQIILNTRKGRKLFEQILPRITCYERSYTEVLEKNPMYMKSSEINSNSLKVLTELDAAPFSQVMERYFMVTAVSKLS